MRQRAAIGVIVWACLGAAVRSAWAESPATPAPDTIAAQTLEGALDNDQLAFTPAREERWYTSGLFARWATPLPSASVAPDARVMAAWCEAVLACDPGARSVRVIGLSQLIFTPAWTGTSAPQPKDWPYAVSLAANLKVMSQGPRTRQTLGLKLGVMGPSAQGEPVVNAVHRLSGQPLALGFDLQVRTQAVLELSWSRLVSVPLREQVDLVTRTAVQLGNPVTEAAVGALFRWGELPAGPSWPGELQPAQWATRSWVVWAGVQGRAVARNQFIDGRTAGYASLVESKPVVGHVFAGASVALAPRWWVDAGAEIRSLEFDAPVGARAMHPQRVGTLLLRYATR
jgi:hypothetical protein